MKLLKLFLLLYTLSHALPAVSSSLVAWQVLYKKKKRFLKGWGEGNSRSFHWSCPNRRKILFVEYANCNPLNKSHLIIMMPSPFSAENLYNACSIHNNTSATGEGIKTFSSFGQVHHIEMMFCLSGAKRCSLLFYYSSVRECLVQVDEVTDQCLHVTRAGSPASQGGKQSSQRQSASSSFPQSLLHYPPNGYKTKANLPKTTQQ